MTTNALVVAKSDDDIARCFDVMAELRPHGETLIDWLRDEHGLHKPDAPVCN